MFKTKRSIFIKVATCPRVDCDWIEGPEALSTSTWCPKCGHDGINLVMGKYETKFETWLGFPIKETWKFIPKGDL